jgi:endo-alpha-1,4-polygalactosaminidase (GH114 family)
MITQEHIDDLGKEAYAKWRQDKTKTNFIKAQMMVTELTPLQKIEAIENRMRVIQNNNRPLTKEDKTNETLRRLQDMLKPETAKVPSLEKTNLQKILELMRD